MDVWITVIGQLALACALVGWALRKNAQDAAAAPPRERAPDDDPRAPR